MKKVLPKLRLSSGFTIIELMVVLTVIAILASMVLYGLAGAQASARDASRQQIMSGVQVALERSYGDNQVYPNNYGNFCNMLNALVGGGYMSTVANDPSKDSSGNTVTVCGSIPSSVKYEYLAPDGSHCTGSTPNAYQLVLTKESGGKNYFCSPQ